MKKELLDKGWKIYMSNTQPRDMRQIDTQSNQTPTVVQTENSQSIPKESLWIKVVKVLSCILGSGAFIAVATATIVLYKDVHLALDRYIYLNKELENINTSIGNIDDTLTGKDGLTTQIASLQTGMQYLNGTIYSNAYISGKSMTPLNYTKSKDVELKPPTWTSPKTVVAKDRISGEEYKVEDLINKKVLLTYAEGSEDIIFYGQYNAQNHWDGSCLINNYNHGTLSFIMEAVYDDGKLISYKQVLPDKNAADENIWVISDRTVNDNINVGVTYRYYKDNDINQTFDLEETTISNLINVDNFRTIIAQNIEGFYKGNTSNGYYNDDTGEAYLVKYTRDGFVKTIYQGNFKNGQFDDDTNNAWSIDKDMDDPIHYMFYHGRFKNGEKIDKDPIEFTNPLKQSDIDHILNGMHFECDIPFDEKAIKKEE